MRLTVKQITIENLKERTASTLNIPAGSQRVIYQGRVLQNDYKLSQSKIFLIFKFLININKRYNFMFSSMNYFSRVVTQSSKIR